LIHFYKSMNKNVFKIFWMVALTSVAPLTRAVQKTYLIKTAGGREGGKGVGAEAHWSSRSDKTVPKKSATGIVKNDKLVGDFIEKAEIILEFLDQTFEAKNWVYLSNMTTEANAASNSAKELKAEMKKQISERLQEFDGIKVEDYDVRRKLKMLREGSTYLSQQDSKKKIALMSELNSLYTSAKVPDFQNKEILMDIDAIQPIFGKSRDPVELAYYWDGFRAATGEKMLDVFAGIVELLNKDARMGGYKDLSEKQVFGYDSEMDGTFKAEDFKQELENSWKELKPLYQQWHAYLRFKLNKLYGDNIVDKNGPIPAHLAGSMYSHIWSSLFEDTLPFPDQPSIDIAEPLKRDGWTQRKMYREADKFFQSLGLSPVKKLFWEKSILGKPKDGQKTECHPKALDMNKKDDFRIIDCESSLGTAHHEMGHVQYFSLYANQSKLYRLGANSGFHEAVGDFISKSVETTSYYKKLGLLPESTDEKNYETNINMLYKLALQRIGVLPYLYLVDLFRWDLYSGEVPMDEANCHWWKLRLQLQGIKPPNKRNNRQFDAGAKIHVAVFGSYIDYYTAAMYQFQFYEAACKIAGEYVPDDPDKPLHRCNFYQSKEVGDMLKAALSVGKSRPWKEVLEKMVGHREMSSSSLRKYFAPLEEFFIRENKKNGVTIGWDEENLDQICS